MKAMSWMSIMTRVQNEKLLLGTILLALISVFPGPTNAGAGVDVEVSISLPPPIMFAAPPEVIVIPETYVYVVPDMDVDIFFFDGWWWRPWEGRWYRSRHYDSGWGYYQRAPSFYSEIPSGWRSDYRDHRWGGQPWNYQRIPHQQVQRNWRDWEKNRHWEKQQTWGVQGLKPRTRNQQPAQAVQPRDQARPRVREAVKPQESQPRQAVQPRDEARPRVQEAAKPQPSQPRQTVQPKPKVRKAAKPHKSGPREGKPEREEKEQKEGK